MPPRWRTAQKPRVCIVGAGVSGLKCADILLGEGVDITIFEARDRIGGRVSQQNIQDHPVDLGANWIHGTHKNPIMELAKETETETADPEEGAAVFDENGDVLGPELSKDLSKILWDIIAEAFQRSNHHASEIPPEKSLKDFLAERLTAKGVAEGEKKIVMQMAEMWGSFVGESFERQSLKWFFLEEVIDGGERVYITIVFSLSKPS